MKNNYIKKIYFLILIYMENYYFSIILGILIIFSYIYVFSKIKSSNWLNHPLWLGISKNKVRLNTILIFLAAFSGLRIAYWGYEKKINNGLLTYNKGNMFHYIVITFLLGSLLWPWMLHFRNNKNKIFDWFVCISLWIVAISTILLIAGVYENNNTPDDVFFSVLILGVVCVLMDGVGWTSRYFIQNIKK